VRKKRSDAIEIGYRLIDTAASYGNEEAVGKAIQKSANRPVLDTGAKTLDCAHSRHDQIEPPGRKHWGSRYRTDAGRIKEH
jgi:diketogulonate reductase-like aldo/keto reductase